MFVGLCIPLLIFCIRIDLGQLVWSAAFSSVEVVRLLCERGVPLTTQVRSSDRNVDFERL